MSGDANRIPPEDLMLEARLRIEDLVDREGLNELCKSFVTLFGIAVRIYSSDGALVADEGGEQELCAYINAGSDGRKACAAVVDAVRALDPGADGDAVQPCFTGAVYRVQSIEYDGRRVGRLIVGPFLPVAPGEPPASLLQVDAAIQPARAKAFLARMPRAKPETVTRITTQLKTVLDLIFFAGHKAHVTTTMHLASVRESYRQLEDKNAHLQQAFDRLKELDRLKSTFLATVSHELRTPLTSIIGYSEMLREGLAGALTAEQQEFVDTIHGKGEQLLSLIVGLLDLSKLESGTMRMTMRSLQIEGVLGEVVSTLAPTARKKGVTLVLDLGSGLPEMRGDPERLRQVFLNLVENALKFTAAGGNVTIGARVVDEDPEEDGADDEALVLMAPLRSRIEVRVVDTGIGIPTRERTKVFDPFYQVDSSSTREHGGTGLGLSIVKRIVEAHDGTVRIEDTAPKGTTFVVSLPQAARSVAETPRVA